MEQLFRKFADRLAGFGHPRRLSESPQAFILRVASEAGLADAQISDLVARLEGLLYNPAVAGGPTELNALRRQLRRLQFRLAFGTSR